MKKLSSNTVKIIALFAVIITTTFSCQKNASNPHTAGTTYMNLHLTDDPSFVFDEVLIDITKVEVKVEDDSTRQESENESEHNGGSGGNNGGSGGNWIVLDIRPGVYNVLNFRNGIDTLLGSTQFPATQAVSKVRITLGANNSVVLNGKTIPLSLHQNSFVINLGDDRVNVAGANLDVFLDFDAGNSIKFRNGVFELNSSVKAFSKEKAGGIEGRVAPEREGEFKIIGLKPGNYSLLVKATANNYKDTTLNGIVVGLKEDTHTGTITLHQ